MSSTPLLLDPAEEAALRKLAQQTGKTEAELVREAVVQFLRQPALAAWQQAVQATQGMWRDRPDLPDFQQLRAEGDRQTSQ